jgi:tetratricopeptide (TPR) repeat protein
MSSARSVCLSATFSLLSVCIAGTASLAGEVPKLKTSIIPSKSTSLQERPSAVVQIAPGFELWDGRAKLVPAGDGHIYLVEQNTGARLLLSDYNDGSRGWVASNSVLPLSAADGYFSQQIQSNPRNAFSFLMRGVVRYENDDLEHAVADVDQSLRLEPNNVSALLVRGCLLQWKNRLEEAVADADKAIQLSPQNSYAFIERAVFEYNMKAYEKAKSDLDQAVKLGSRAAVLHICRGMICLEQSDLKQAHAEFTAALQIDPKHPDAHCGLASVFLKRSDTKHALLVLDRAVEIDPQSADSHGNRAVILLSLGKYDKALDDLDDLLKVAPNSARALKERAWILATCPETKVRNGEQAVATATRACELTQWKEPHYLATLAAAYSEAGDFDNAVTCQKRAIDLSLTKAPEIHEYNKLLDRYKSKKPYRQLGLLYELGIPNGRPAAKKSD